MKWSNRARAFFFWCATFLQKKPSMLKLTFIFEDKGTTSSLRPRFYISEWKCWSQQYSIIPQIPVRICLVPALSCSDCWLQSTCHTVHHNPADYPTFQTIIIISIFHYPTNAIPRSSHCPNLVKKRANLQQWRIAIQSHTMLHVNNQMQWKFKFM